ncbi:hypothetical protein INS49_013784 [Diaporthe citri]|uniref:uncharacterized protein n=1 Tax=Diaporthe citri TaxID=83186 RepID=UPI001C7F9165|nr:uncharacterized protein INS49_013784 [Diaporthe citri]KAG6357901.1 hypothetical protein INS49_013784 [Diaporthe citri]
MGVKAMGEEAMGEVQATAAPGTDATTQTKSQTAEDHVDIIKVPSPSRPGGAHLWLLMDEVGGDDEDIVGAHVRLCGAGTSVDTGKLAPAVDRGGAVAVRSRRRRRGAAPPEGTAVAACVSEAGEVVLQDETGDEAGEAVQADAVVVHAAALRGEAVGVPVTGRCQAVR